MIAFLRCVFTKSKISVPTFPVLMHAPELTVRVGRPKTCWNESNAFSGLGLHRTFCEKSNDDLDDRVVSSAMDTLVKNLQTQLNLSKSTRRKAAGVVPDDFHPAQAVVSKRKGLQRAYKENQECDTVIHNMLRGGVCPTEILAALQKYAIADQFPSRKTLVMVAGACASKGHIEGIQAVSDVCEIAYPAEVIWQMNYRHYEAEAHWKLGNIEQSLKVFQDLFEMHPLKRRKIINMSAFLMRHVINNELADFYPKLGAFVDFCINYKEFVPAANLWRTAFCSDSYKANCFAEELLTKYSSNLLPIVEGKVPAILGEAQTLKQVDVIQKLMQFVLNYELKEHYPSVFGAYMDYKCDANDVDGALETFYFISKSSIIISSESIQKLQALIALHKRKPPNIMLPQIGLNKFDVAKPPSSSFKF